MCTVHSYNQSSIKQKRKFSKTKHQKKNKTGPISLVYLHTLSLKFRTPFYTAVKKIRFYDYCLWLQLFRSLFAFAGNTYSVSTTFVRALNYETEHHGPQGMEITIVNSERC